MPTISEFQLQRATAIWLHGRNNLPGALSNDVIAWHTPNGGARSAREGGRMKESGVVPGIFDWTFVGRGKFWAIELKVGTGELSADQREMWSRYHAAGAAGIALCRTLEHFKAVVRDWQLTITTSRV